MHEGLSLSQAARKHDIPYPTFVLYANRVHNMLGPSVRDGSPAIGGTLVGWLRQCRVSHLVEDWVRLTLISIVPLFSQLCRGYWNYGRGS